MAQRKEIASFPAYRVMDKVRPWFDRGLVHLKDGMQLACPNARGSYDLFTAGSVMGYCRDDLQPGQTIQDALDQNAKNGGTEHWINGQATVLSAHKEPQRTYFLIEVGDIVLFEGKTYRVQPAPNDNLKLVPIDYVKEE